jgi:hypothetical protein
MSVPDADQPPRKKRGPAKGDPRSIEAGKRGGQKLLEQRGRAYYQAMGRKGGETTRERMGCEFYSSIGQQGGEALAASRGVEFYRAIGRLGNKRRGDSSDS